MLHPNLIYRIAVLLVIAPLFAIAQTPSFNFQKLGSEEGLNNANIFHISQHRNGVVYMTTQNGIYYYDGYIFNKLEIDSLKTNALLGMAFKSDDEIYLSIRNEGIAVYNLSTRQYSRPENLKLRDNNADEMLFTEDYAYLLNSRIRLTIIDLKTGKVIPDEINRTNRQNQAYCIYRLKSGKILIGRSDGIYEARGNSQVATGMLSKTAVHSISENSNAAIVAGTSSRIVTIRNGKTESEIAPEYKTKSTTFDLGGDKSINNILSDSHGRIWFTSSPDESLYLQVTGSTYDMFSTLDIPSTLIRCVFMDDRQNIWIGTYSDGVYCIQNTFFNNLSFFYNNKNLNINQALLKDNLLIAATSNGLYGLNLRNNQARTLSRPDETFMEPVYGVTEMNDVMLYTKLSPFYMSPALVMDANRTYRFKPVLARIFYPIDAQHSVVADRELNILLCNADASSTLDTLISFTDYRMSVNAMLKIDELLYVGTNSGLYVYNFKTKTYRNEVRSDLNYNINDLSVIGGKLYVAHEAGITDYNGHKLIQVAGKFRLNSVRRIRMYNQQVWLSTLDGVFICDTTLEPLKILDKSAGLLSNSVNDVIVKDNIVVISTARGVSTTGYENIKAYNTTLKPVTVHAVRAGETQLEPQSGRYKLEPDQDNITVSFYSPVFKRPNNQFFRFRLDEGEWETARNLTTINVSVPGGAHHLQIMASADNITWSEPVSLQFDKKEKLTEKQSVYWLITTGSLALIFAISFVWVRRVKIKARKRLQDEQQINLLKHQAMNALLSPHFIFNSLTSIQNYINTNNSLRASEYLAKFSRLIRMIIEKAAQSEISLHDELARLTYYLELEKERFKNKFDYYIHLDENINTHQIMIPNMIIQPYVENCILHGILPKHQHGELRISFRAQQGKKFLITIEDNGIGLIKAAEHAKAGHKSLGTSTIRNILDINYKLSGKRQNVTMVDKSTMDPLQTGTLITIELEL